MALEFPKDMIARVAADYEGKLFLSVTMYQFGDSIEVSKHYYTVKSGIVYMVNEHGEQASGDTLLTMASECKVIGKYNPKKGYKTTSQNYTVAQFCKIHKL